LGPVVGSLVEAANFVTPQNPASLAPMIDRTSSSLSSILQASTNLSVDSKNALKQTIYPAIQPVLRALSIYSSISLSHNSDFAINNAAASLLLLLLSILTALNKEVGTDFKVLVISTLVEGLSSITPSATPLTLSQTIVIRMLNKTLLTVFSSKSSSLTPVIASAMDLIANKVSPICKANDDNTASLLPSLLSTTYVILVCQWSTITFKETPIASSSRLVGIKVAGMPNMPRRPLMLVPGIKDSLKKSPSRVKPEFAALFELLCSLFLFSIQADNLSPTVVSKGVKMLLGLGRKTKFFHCINFRDNMRPTFVSAILSDLLKLNQPLLVDDMNLLLFEMVSSDFNGFFNSILPGMIDSMGITNEEKISMMETWSREEDNVTFRQSCENFLSEFRFYQNSV